MTPLLHNPPGKVWVSSARLHDHSCALIQIGGIARARKNEPFYNFLVRYNKLRREQAVLAR